MLEPSFWQTLPDILRQPAAIAMVGSALAHGIFFAVLPTITGSPLPDTDSPRVVGVVDLSPEDRSRLPQALTSQKPLPPIQTQKGTKLFTPDSFEPYKLPNLGFPSVSVIPTPTDAPIQFDDNPFPTRTERRIITKPEGTKPEGTKPEGTKPEGTKPEGTKPEGTKPEGTKPEGTKPEGTKPEGTKPEETKPERTEPVTPPSEVLKREMALRQKYQHNPTGTIANLDIGNWLKTFPEDQRGAPNSQKEPLSATYPDELPFVLNPPPKPANVYVVINSEEKKIVDHNFIQRTGYEELDQEALKVVETEALRVIQEKTDKNEPVKPLEIFWRAVEFKPKNTKA
jgi:hypothetical protein